MKLLEGQRILVTGASRGIGRAIALACAREGAVLGVNYRLSEKAARDVEREIGETHGACARLLCFDVSDADGVKRAVEEFCGEFGGVDALVNNAACFYAGLLATLSTMDVQRQIAVNLAGPIHCARAVLPHMIRQKCGLILNISSVSAARPSPGQAVYAATKGALETFTRALAVEYARKGVRALCLCPGPTDTRLLAATIELAGPKVIERTPLGRLARPEEVAELAVFLLSGKMAFASGSTYTLDGGYVIG